MKTLEEGLSEFYAAQREAMSAPLSLVRNKRQKSVALAVHPSQVQEAIDDARKKGVPTDFTPDGRPVFESRSHRKKYMTAYRFFDRDAGYGDAAPRYHRGKKAPPSRIKELARKLAHRIRTRHTASLRGY